MTNDPQYINTYTVKVTGTLTDGATASTTYTLNIINPCATSTISPPASITPSIYYVFGADMDFTVPSFTYLAHATCSQFTYLLTKLDDTAIDSTIFTFTPGTRNLHVSTTDVNHIGFHDFKYTGYLL